MMKQIINLLESATFELGNVKVAPYGPKQASTAKDKSDLAFQVRLVRVDHIRYDDVHDGPKNSLASGGQSDRLCTERRGGNFAEECKCNASDGDLVNESVHHGARRLDPASGGGVDNVEDAHEHKHNRHADHAPDEEFPATQSVDGHPRNHDADDTASRNTNTQVERVAGLDTREFEKVGRKAEDEHNSGQVLTSKGTDGNRGADKVGALEALDPSRGFG